MGRGGMLRVSVPLLNKHMVETGKALSLRESAELLGMSPNATLEVLNFMEATGIVQRIKRKKQFYFLKDTYDEESIKTMIQEAVERDIIVNGRTRKRSKYDPIIDRFLEGEHDRVRVDIVGVKHTYVAVLLQQRIKARELGDVIESYTADKCVYLEKI